MAQDHSPPPLPAEDATPSVEAQTRPRPRYKSRPPERLASSSERAYRSFDRRKRGLRCATVELRESEIDFLIKIELLAADAPKNPRTLGNALNRYLDDNPLGGWVYKSRY